MCLTAALLLSGCAASKHGAVAGIGDGQRVDMTGLVTAAVDAAIEAKLDVQQETAGVGDGQRSSQSGIANFAIENEMSVMLGVILLAVLLLMGFDKLLAFWLQRIRILNDRLRWSPGEKTL